MFCSTFLVTWGGAYSVKNVLFTFYIWDSSFLTTWTVTRYGVQKLDKAAKFLGKAENELQGKFFLPPIRFKIRLFTSCTYNYAF